MLKRKKLAARLQQWSRPLMKTPLRGLVLWLWRKTLHKFIDSPSPPGDYVPPGDYIPQGDYDGELDGGGHG